MVRKEMEPISREVPNVATVERAIVALMDDNNYLVGPLDPEEVNIGVLANQGLMYASLEVIGDALTNLIKAGELRIILAAKAGEELKAHFGRI